MLPSFSFSVAFRRCTPPFYFINVQLASGQQLASGLPANGPRQHQTGPQLRREAPLYSSEASTASIASPPRSESSEAST